MKKIREFGKIITCCMLSFLLCFSSIGSCLFYCRPVRVEAAAAVGTASVLDWFLTLLAAAGFAYTSSSLADSELQDYLKSLSADINTAANASTIEELQEKLPWLSGVGDENTIESINQELGYMYKSLTDGKSSAAEAYPEVDSSKADKNNIIRMSDWMKNRWNNNMPFGPIGANFVTIKPSVGVELTDRVAVLLSENWPASLPVYGSMRSFFNFLQEHTGEYVSDSSRFFVYIDATWLPDIFLSIVEIPEDVRYIRLTDFAYGFDVSSLKPSSSFKTQRFALSSDKYSLFGNLFGYDNFNIDNASLHGNLINDSEDSVFVLFSDTDNLYLVDGNLQEFTDRGDIVRISESISDSVPTKVVDSNAIIDAVNAALSAGSTNKDYDFSEILNMLSAANDQQHEDNDKQLVQLTLISSLLSSFNDFFIENSKQAAADINKINMSLDKAGQSIVDAVLNINMSDIVNALNKIDMGTLALINTNVSDISLSIPNAVDNLKTALNNLPIGDIANDIASIDTTLKIDINGAFNTLQHGITADIRILSDDINEALNGLGIQNLGANISALLSQILGKVSSIDSTFTYSFDTFDTGGKGFDLINLLHAIFMILFLLLKIFVDCLVFITLIFNIKAEPYFLNDYMIQGLDWLKTTEITGFGVSIHTFLMNLISIIVIFAVVGTLKRHIHRMKIK